jgi:hypothetical protein
MWGLTGYVHVSGNYYIQTFVTEPSTVWQYYEVTMSIMPFTIPVT